jgi:hypothetical protein
MRGKASQSCKSRFKASYFKLGFLAELLLRSERVSVNSIFYNHETGVGCAAVLLGPLT